jgi:hypothetical protein
MEQIIARWAVLFESGTVSLPQSADGIMRTLLI